MKQFFLLFLSSGFPSHQQFQPQPMSTGSPFSPPGPSVPAASLSGPQLPPSSSTPGSLPPMPSPGVPPTGFMPSTSLPSSFMPPSSQPGGPVPMYPGGLHNQGPAAPPMTSGHYAPLGSGYPQGGPGAPAVKPFPTAVVPPPPTGTCHAHLEDQLYWYGCIFKSSPEHLDTSRLVIWAGMCYWCSAVTPFLTCRILSLAEFPVWWSRWLG